MTSGIRGGSRSAEFADALAGADGTSDPSSSLAPLPVFADPTLVLSSDLAAAGMHAPEFGADRWAAGPLTGMPGVSANAAVGGAIDPAMVARAEAELAQQRAAQQAAAAKANQDRQHDLAARRDAAARSAVARAAPGPSAGGQIPPQVLSFTQWLPKSAQDAVRHALAAQANPQQQGQPHPAYRPPAVGQQARTQQYQPAKPKKKSSGAWGVLIFIIVVLFATGLGQRIVEALTQLFNR